MPNHNYIWHTTTTTGDNRKSLRDEVGDDVVALMKEWLVTMRSGQAQAVLDDKYACRIEIDKRKYATFAIYRLSDNMQTKTDIIRFALCKHSKRKADAWAAVAGVGEPPQPPFCAVELLDNLTLDDMPYLALLADFERCLAWAWLEKESVRNDE